jgi:predicted helicase
MNVADQERLRAIKTFPSLVKYLRDELYWPIESDDFDDLTFDYEPEELGIDSKTAAKIDQIKQLRPLADEQPWGIFFVKFEPKRLPVVALRRVLRSLVIKKRSSANRSEQAAWHLNDLLFISAYGDGNERQITFSHFAETPGTNDLPTLRVLGWDDSDTPLHLDHVQNELHGKLQWPDDEEEIDTWRETWSSAFTIRHREVITTSRQLAVRLAELARVIRRRVNTILSIESEKGSLRKLMSAFQETLIHDLSKDNFADMYAQTIAYGLLSARVSQPSDLVADNLAEMVPITNPFLKELLETFLSIGGRKKLIDFDELGVNDVVETLRNANMEAVLRDFGDRNPQEDPVIHFYELFIAEYDAKKRMQRGVFYTPRPVVSFIVRSVDEILRTEFGLEDGLADTTTWGEMADRLETFEIPQNAEHNDPFVQILDPATGTGTFLVEVIGSIYQTMANKWKSDGRMDLEIQNLWNEYVPQHLLPRLYGFELMMAPYTIAHMKIGLKLFETGYKFGSDQRAHIFLTNALEPPHDISNQLQIFAPALAHEAIAGNKIKSDSPITVVIGNPPYANFGMLNKNDWIISLLDDYKRDLNERKLNLDDDFIKFIRYSQYIIEVAKSGILGFITNNTFLDGITHRRMRQSLLSCFNSGKIIDLHGSSKKKETCPDGSPDENVFNIQQGVGISLFSRFKDQSSTAKLSHIDLQGLSEEKYQFLLNHRLNDLAWENLQPISDSFLFKPTKEDNIQEYAYQISLNDVWNEYISGVQTKLDDLFVGYSEEEVASKMKVFLEPTLREHDEFIIKLTKPWVKKKAQGKKFNKDFIRPYIVAPFDFRYIYYDPSLLGRARFKTMRHMSDTNWGFVFMRQSASGQVYDHFLIVRHLVTDRVFYSAHGAPFLAPLYSSMGDRGILHSVLGGQPNIQSKVVKSFTKELGLSWVKKGRGDLFIGGTIGPEDVLHYMYSQFYSLIFRSRYSEFLKKDFPHVFITENLELFRSLCQLGAELVAFHLLEDDYEAAPWNPDIAALKRQKPSFIQQGTSMVAKGYPKFEEDRIFINESCYFDGVTEEVWSFYVGGYQVCQKWLKDRGPKKGNPGRILSREDIAHYQKIVVALNETIRLMAEIDQVIEKYGGWPGAFVTDKIPLEPEGQQPSLL